MFVDGIDFADVCWSLKKAKSDNAHLSTPQATAVTEEAASERVLHTSDKKAHPVRPSTAATDVTRAAVTDNTHDEVLTGVSHKWSEDREDVYHKWTVGDAEEQLQTAPDIAPDLEDQQLPAVSRCGPPPVGGWPTPEIKKQSCG